jgi:hypothetical protein
MIRGSDEKSILGIVFGGKDGVQVILAFGLEATGERRRL